ncbi:MAG: hypothetical protein RSF34_18770 [Flavobacterium sp.]|uniref:hypothetical protein n=1 Tax=Flavobacterium sp. TaxID=239 RepID=UPI002FCB1E1D
MNPLIEQFRKYGSMSEQLEEELNRRITFHEGKKHEFFLILPCNQIRFIKNQDQVAVKTNPVLNLLIEMITNPNNQFNN